MTLKDIREAMTQLDREAALLADRRHRLEEKLRYALDTEIIALRREHLAAGTDPAFDPDLGAMQFELNELRQRFHADLSHGHVMLLPKEHAQAGRTA